jgi:hypothetical protein
VICAPSTVTALPVPTFLSAIVPLVTPLRSTLTVSPGITPTGVALVAVMATTLVPSYTRLAAAKLPAVRVAGVMSAVVDSAVGNR